MTCTVVVGRRRHVQYRIGIEEPHRFQHEPAAGHRRYRPVLGTGHVMVAEGVPHHQIRILDVPAGRSVLGQTRATGMLVGVRPGGRNFIRVIRCDPQVLGHKTGAFDNAGGGVGEGQDIVPRHKLVAHWLAQSVGDRGIGDTIQ